MAEANLASIAPSVRRVGAAVQLRVRLLSHMLAITLLAEPGRLLGFPLLTSDSSLVEGPQQRDCLMAGVSSQADLLKHGLGVFIHNNKNTELQCRVEFDGGEFEIAVPIAEGHQSTFTAHKSVSEVGILSATGKSRQIVCVSLHRPRANCHLEPSCLPPFCVVRAMVEVWSSGRGSWMI